ncbi:MAG TPA: hypothetical protein VMK13_11110 [Streptosporangiaceae bacterium]|nr:hypothetical protein [Streptosporangiaceae bacterium]
MVISDGALITDPAGRPLLVKPNYRDCWSLPAARRAGRRLAGAVS